MYRISLWSSCAVLFAQVVLYTANRGTLAWGSLIPRQTDGDIPTQCQSICDPVISLIDTGCTIQACCTNTFIQNLTSCYECVGNLSQTTNYSIPQSTIDGVVEDCASVGLNITDPTLPGQNASRTLSSLHGSSTPVVNQTTITALSLTTSTFTQSTITSVNLTTPTSSSQNAPTSSSESSSTSPIGTTSPSTSGGEPTRHDRHGLTMLGSLSFAWGLLLSFN
ncbi:hypothetical protein F5878DRAFT_377614 [Lentinula raphanica]|uniref:Extracellular membrane protein CFEM domain-containing protein n=1 Tax=Lentinula raphanica TaxID=153919 RepID=A0AA38PGP0_9AGAR|nr:hypothetical protein F5878DRAFT_377614 [Lentinula raphanica]